MGKTNGTYVVLLLLLMMGAMGLVGCSRLERQGDRLEKQLAEQMEQSMHRTNQLAQHLHNSFDSIWVLTQPEEDDATLFFVFDNHRMVYWSDNWLAGHEVILLRYDEWYYWRFDNAHCVCRWTRADVYNILTVIPIQYAYPIENRQLKNTFVQPFEKLDDYQIVRSRDSHYRSILAPNGQYLFSLAPRSEHIAEETKEPNKLAPTFSYQAVLADAEQGDSGRKNSGWYFILGVVAFALITIIGIIGLIRNRGFQYMSLRTKFTYAIMTLVLVNAVYAFVVSVRYVRQTYEKQQRNVLQRKTRYLQKALQDIYFWNISLGEQHRLGMNIDLRDLSFAYEMDIHVYDMNGDLVGSSTPELFERGLLSKHIAPEPFFAKSATMIQHEHIGDMRYLAAYTELYNGSYVQIGYIAVPFFISDEEVSRQVDTFLAKLLPSCLLIMIISLLISLIMAQELTQPLTVLADKMKLFRIGQRSNRLHYDRADEVGQLVGRYNELMDELEHSTEQLARSEREGAWRTMARQIAHEINNSLTPMKLTLQQLQRTKNSGDERFDAYFERSSKLLIEQIDNLSHIAHSFSDFAKLPEVVTMEVDVAQKLTSVIQLFRNNQNNVPIRYIGVERSVMAMADGEQITRVFNNLIKNAIQAVENKEDGDIIIILKKLPNVVEIAISDNGDGIPVDLQEKIFRPNFTTKSTGMGLGLPISKNIVEGSGGTITFKTTSRGTTFFVHLRYPDNQASNQHQIIELEDA